MTLDQMDLVEINEAFASVVLAWEKEHHPDMSRSTSTAARSPSVTRSAPRAPGCMTTLLAELERTGGRYGLQTMCEGGGMANATIIERLGWQPIRRSDARHEASSGRQARSVASAARHRGWG